MPFRIRWCVIVAAATAVYVGGIAHADALADARKAIQTQYNLESAATAKRDTTAMFAIYSPGFVTVDIKHKKHTLADVKQQTQLLFAQARIIVGSAKIQSITLNGNTARVRVTEHSKLTGNDPSTNTDSIVVFDSTAEDVWALTNGHWLETKSKTLTFKSSLNGRPLE